MKPTWTHTHNGENGEELCLECGKYYTRFAWDNFAAAYTGRVRPAHRDRPRADFAVGPDGEITWVNYPPQYGVIDTSDILVGNLFPDDEITLEVP